METLNVLLPAGAVIVGGLLMLLVTIRTERATTERDLRKLPEENKAKTRQSRYDFQSNPRMLQISTYEYYQRSGDDPGLLNACRDLQTSRDL
jgi:hypothetical protein